jgi:hypothetical protein
MGGIEEPVDAPDVENPPGRERNLGLQQGVVVDVDVRFTPGLTDSHSALGTVLLPFFPTSATGDGYHAAIRECSCGTA